MPLRRWQADLLLLGVTAVWGGTFPMVKRATELTPPFTFLALRFDLAALALIMLFAARLRRAPAATWAAGALIGVFLWAGYALQTLGLTMTTPAKAGFITGLTVVLVPVISLVWLRRQPRPAVWAGVALATVGLGLMTLEGDTAAGLLPTAGDLLVMGCAVAFALHVAAVARWAGPHDPSALTAVQVLTAAVLNHVAAALLETWPEQIPGYVWWAVAVTALVATALGFWLQNVLQPLTTPTHTALIFSAEPVWAALFSWLLAGDVLTGRAYLGGALILAGMLVAEWPLRPGPLPANRKAAGQAARSLPDCSPSPPAYRPTGRRRPGL